MTFQPKNIAPPKKVIDPLIDPTEDVRHSEAVPGDAPEAFADEGAPSVLSEPVTIGAEEAPSERHNDAFLYGVETPGYIAMLDQPASLMTGTRRLGKGGRSTQDGEWTPKSMPWRAWINGGGGGGTGPIWGFSRHPVSKNKDGACIVLGSSVDRARMAKAMDTMYALGLDIDSGASLDAILDKLEDQANFCLVYTTHSHGRRGLQLKQDDVLRKLGIKPSELDLEAVKTYLRHHDKNRYEESFIEAITINTAKLQTKDGMAIALETPPLHKFRIVYPLAEPVKLIELAETQHEALKVWENKITGLATETLAVHFDVACTDPSRLFFTARHPKDAEDWHCAIVRGDPLRFEDVPEVSKQAYARARVSANLDPFIQASGAGNGDKPPMAYTPSGKSLNEWHNKAKTRFLLADVLETYCPDRIRNIGGEAHGHVHVECPFESEHSKEGGTGTMAVNALDSKNEYWTWFCHHDACQGRHKLGYLEEALRQGWFEESVMFDDEFILPPGDGEEDPLLENEAPRDRTERHAEAAASTRDALLEMVAPFGPHTTGAQVRAVIQRALEVGADEPAMERLKEAIIAAEVINANPYNTMLKEVRATHRKKKRKQKSNASTQQGGVEIPACDVLEDFPRQLEYAKERIHEANSECPRFFQFGGAYATANAADHLVRLMEGRDSMNLVLTRVTRWAATDGNGNSRLVAPPDSVVKTLSKDYELAESLPELLAVPSSPFFDWDGNLVDTDGYHAGARVYLAKGDLVLKGVSPVPTPEEVTEAKRLLVEEVIADFPLAGMGRDEIVATLKGENADKAHAVTHAVAFALLPFCRDMIAGPTPGHVFTKPGPGTGASLLVEMLTIITGGAPAPAMDLPGDQAEMSKTLSSALAKGSPVIFFDNVGKGIASSVLAMAMTGTTYQARLLGRTQLVTVPVRAVWCFTGNDITGSKEILRRLLLTPLDARVPDPQERTPPKGWRHVDLRKWVTDNRPDLVWACLTIIQNWVAKGMKRAAKPSLASYESWAGVMGGILRDAGFDGFLEGQEAEREKAADTIEDGQEAFLRVLAEYPDGTLLRAGGTRKYKDEDTVSIRDILNGNARHKPKVGEGLYVSPTNPDNYTPPPIPVHNWGYNKDDEAYNTPTKIGRGMKVFARKPYRVKNVLISLDPEMVADVEISFEEITDHRDASNLYRLKKKILEKRSV